MRMFTEPKRNGPAKSNTHCNNVTKFAHLRKDKIVRIQVEENLPQERLYRGG